MKQYKTDIAILGAGASGLFLAYHLKKDFLLIDHSSIPKKLKISGGSKCNFTNQFLSVDNYLGDKELLEKVFEEYDNDDLLKFFSSKIKYQKIKNNQYFALKSTDIIDILDNQNKLISTIKDIEKKDDKFFIYTSKGVVEASKVVVATGGVSFKSLGATDIGYNIASKFGHTIKRPTPALVGLTVQKDQFWMKNLSGISVDAIVKVKDKSFKDSVLFSYKGITGPAILSTSLYWDKGSIEIDFLPNYKYKKSNKTTITNSLPLPRRFIAEFLKAYNFSDEVKYLEDVVNRLKNYSFAPAGNFGFEKAEVTKGGVDTSELVEFESKYCKNLYFIGEVVDITGELGGYNLQWCFSSAKYLSKRL